MIEDGLGPADGEGRNDHGSAAANTALDGIAKGRYGIQRLMAPVAIGRFDDQIIRFHGRRGIEHDRIVEAAQVSREEDRAVTPFEFDECRPEYMSGTMEAKFGAPCHRTICPEADRIEIVERHLGVL